MLDRSVEAKLSCWAIIKNIVGAPNILPTLCFSMRARTVPASKLRSKTTSIPLARDSSVVTLRPPMWNKGAQVKVVVVMVSSPKHTLILFQNTLPWVNIAPLGSPVVPEVYMIKAISSAPTCSLATIGSAPTISGSSASHPSASFSMVR